MTTKTQKVREGAEKAFYASVGAPVVTTKKYVKFVKTTGESIRTKAAEADMSSKVADLRTKAVEEFKAMFDAWADQGEELINGLRDQKVVEDLAERVNLDQFQEQAGKLRTQLEDLVSNWRSNFAPEEVMEKATEGVKKAADKATKTVKKAESKVVAGVKDVSEKLTKDEDLTIINGIGPAYAVRLKEAKIDTFGKLAKSSVDQLVAAARVRPELASKWIAQAKSL
jgi:predicted flap endonuclease-1-like 5' DNA nuclease